MATSYSDLLKDPRWQKKRLEVFQRDKWACRSCGSTEKTLHVHHIIYKYGANPWEYPLDNFLTLCEPCHQLEERMKTEDYNTRFQRYSEVSRIPIYTLFKWVHTIAFLHLHYPELYEEIRIKSKAFKDTPEFEDFFNETIAHHG
jgi:hypothetical protein